jgi:hypothetical protein
MDRIRLPIADPCHEDWDAMDPRERGRFCRSCDKQVHDLSSMTEHEARDVLREHAGGNLCVRYVQDRTGNIRFRPARPVRAAALALAMAACTPTQQQPEKTNERPQAQEQAQELQVVGELVDPGLDEVMGGLDEIEGGYEHELMGDVAAPEPEDKAEPRPLMGRPMIPGKPEQEGDVPDEPCDTPKPR